MVMVSLYLEPFTFLVRIIVLAFRLFERILTLNKDENNIPIIRRPKYTIYQFFSHQGWVPLSLMYPASRAQCGGGGGGGKKGQN